jgi:hypothetical protein
MNDDEFNECELQAMGSLQSKADRCFNCLQHNYTEWAKHGFSPASIYFNTFTDAFKVAGLVARELLDAYRHQDQTIRVLQESEKTLVAKLDYAGIANARQKKRLAELEEEAIGYIMRLSEMNDEIDERMVEIHQFKQASVNWRDRLNALNVQLQNRDMEVKALSATIAELKAKLEGPVEPAPGFVGFVKVDGEVDEHSFEDFDDGDLYTCPHCENFHFHHRTFCPDTHKRLRFVGPEDGVRPLKIEGGPTEPGLPRLGKIEETPNGPMYAVEND